MVSGAGGGVKPVGGDFHAVAVEQILGVILVKNSLGDALAEGALSQTNAPGVIPDRCREQLGTAGGIGAGQHDQGFVRQVGDSGGCFQIIGTDLTVELHHDPVPAHKGAGGARGGLGGAAGVGAQVHDPYGGVLVQSLDGLFHGICGAAAEAGAVDIPHGIPLLIGDDGDGDLPAGQGVVLLAAISLTENCDGNGGALLAGDGGPGVGPCVQGRAVDGDDAVSGLKSGL